MGDRSYPGTVLEDVMGAGAWGSKIYTLRGVGWLRADVYAACSVCVVWGRGGRGEGGNGGDFARRSGIRVFVFKTISSNVLQVVKNDYG